MDKTTTMRAIFLAGAALSAPAYADEAPAPKDKLDAIVVTAQRRQENLQSVPMQVTALDAGTIERSGIKSTVDALTMVPNVSFDESFTYLNSFVTVRGIEQINNADSPVAVVVDGVPQNNQKQLRMDLFDIQQIEVLKGPQGGIYGRNALGGAINIVTKAPTNQLEGFADVSYGNGNTVSTTGAISGPIVKDVLLYRVTANFKRSDGLIEDSYTRKNVDFIKHDYEFRGELKFMPNSRLTFDLRGSYRNVSAGSIYDSVVLSGNANDIEAPQSNIMGQTFGHIADVSLKADYDLGGVTLTSITAHTDLQERYVGDLDFSNPVDLPNGFDGLGFQVGQSQDLKLHLTSQELRLVSDAKKPFRWIVGAYYLHTQRDLETIAFVDENGSLDQVYDPALWIIHSSEGNSDDAYAFYGQFDLDFLDRFTLSGALRYDNDHRNQTNLLEGTDRQLDFNRVEPKVTLTYKFDPKRLVYATFGTGFRSGGFNAPTVALQSYQAETLQNYEAGFKTSWFDDRLRFNGAVYFEKDHDYQYFYIDVTTASQIIGNIPRVDIWGVEFDAQAKVTGDLTVNAGLGTTDTRIRQLDIDPQYVGNHTPKTTPFSANAGLQYQHRLSDLATLTLNADYQYRGRKYWQIDNADVQKPVNIVNLRGSVTYGRWTLSVYGRNVLNIKYYSDYNPKAYSGSAYDIGFRAQPATYGVEAKVKF